MEEMEAVLNDEPLEREEDERTGIWKAVLIVLAIGLVLLIALGVLRYWMVNYYGGW
jgi:hypothetical protein